MNTMTKASFFPALLNNVDTGLFVLDKNKTIIYWNKWLEKHSTITKDQALDQPFEELFPELINNRIFEAIEQAIHEGYPSIISNVFNRTPFPLYPTAHSRIGTFDRIQQAINVTPVSIDIHTTGNEENYCLIQINDVTAAVTRENALENQVEERRQAQQALAQERSLFVAGPSIIFKWQATEGLPVEYVSPNIQTLLGYEPSQFTEGKLNFLDLLHPDDLKRMIGEIRTNSNREIMHYEQEYRIANCDREYRWYHVVTAIIRNNQKTITHYHGYAQDITERKQAEAEVQRLAYHDALTELPNRRLFMDRLLQEISRCQRQEQFGAVLFMDLDHFKTINDSLGHNFGDALLNEVASRLKNCLRSEDTVARMGGDEFVLLLTQLGGNEEAAAVHAGQIANKIRGILAFPYDIQGQELHISPSIGICLFPSEEHQPEVIITHADTAMYRAKETGRNTYCFYHSSMQDAANERLSLEKDLHNAVKEGELALHVQPQVDRHGKVLAAECLLRWQQPQRGMVSPAEFIPVAEETGLILPIGDWVIETACEELHRWKKLGLTELDYLAVNVSPRQFRQADFVNKVIDIVNKKDASPHQLVIEITEGLLMTEVEDSIKKINQLKEYGIRIAIDDFGTGYSSLAYLNQLPLNILKIDQSFVRDISAENGNASIVQTIIAMAHNLNLKVVAEGVENDQELDYLAKEGCLVYQGFHFYRPAPISGFIELLSKNTDNSRNETFTV